MFKWIRDAKRLPQVERQLDQALSGEQNAQRVLYAVQQQLSSANLKLAELEGKIRKQNEADLLLLSMQIVNRLTAGEKKDSPQLQSLIAQQAAAMQNVYPQGMSGIGLLGNVFGGAAAAALPWQ
jgi:conjugal transfer/entry exclusion protein